MCWSNDGFEVGGSDRAMIWVMFEVGRVYVLAVKTGNGVDMFFLIYTPMVPILVSFAEWSEQDRM